MKRALDTEDLRLWAVVAATVRPLRPPLVGRDSDAERRRVGNAGASTNVKSPTRGPGLPHPTSPGLDPGSATLPTRGREVEAVEAGLRRRLARGREPAAARIDLHGLTHDAARAALTGFIQRSVQEGWRAVLVITGKGAWGDGLLRRLTPEWLAAPPLREHIAGVSQAHRRHGGEGALYVALRRLR